MSDENHGMSSAQLHASGAMGGSSNPTSSQGNGGGSGGGLMGNVGGKVDLGVFGEGKTMPMIGEGSMDSIFTKINSHAFLSQDLVSVVSDITEHQAGGKFELADAGLHKTGQGITAPLNTHTQAFGAPGAGLGREGEGQGH